MIIDELLSQLDVDAPVRDIRRGVFDYGIDAVAGTRVTNPELALRCLSQGANFRQIQGTRRLILSKHVL